MNFGAPNCFKAETPEFQYRVQVLLKKEQVDGSLGKLKYYAIALNFRGVEILEKIIQKSIFVVLKMTHTYLPSKNQNPEWYERPKMHQLQKHSKTR